MNQKYLGNITRKKQKNKNITWIVAWIFTSSLIEMQTQELTQVTNIYAWGISKNIEGFIKYCMKIKNGLKSEEKRRIIEERFERHNLNSEGFIMNDILNLSPTFTAPFVTRDSLQSHLHFPLIFPIQFLFKWLCSRFHVVTDCFTHTFSPKKNNSEIFYPFTYTQRKNSSQIINLFPLLIAVSLPFWIISNLNNPEQNYDVSNTRALFYHFGTPPFLYHREIVDYILIRNFSCARTHTQWENAKLR